MARFYTRVEPDPALLRGYEHLIAAATELRRLAATARDMRVRAQLLERAAKVVSIMESMMRRLDQQAQSSAREADVLIRQHIDQTRVRPPASGRMAAHVLSRPIATTLPSGAFGIADLDELDKSTPSNRRGRSGIPYWMAQEFGSTAAVGRKVPGYFQPGQARPNAAEFRVHPFFEQQQYTRRSKIPAMVVKNPIHARHFLRDGSADALAAHLKALNAIEQEAVAAMRTV